MKMSPVKMILFRLYNISLGRFACPDRLLRRLLVRLLVKEKDESYSHLSSYFDYKELKKD